MRYDLYLWFFEPSLYSQSSQCLDIDLVFLYIYVCSDVYPWFSETRYELAIRTYLWYSDSTYALAILCTALPHVDIAVCVPMVPRT